MALKAETRFKDLIRKKIGALKWTWVVKIAQVSIRGTPDLLVCCRGHFVALELKAEEKSPITKIQVYTLEEIRKAGGKAWIVHPGNWPEVYKCLQLISKGEL